MMLLSRLHTLTMVDLHGRTPNDYALYMQDKFEPMHPHFRRELEIPSQLVSDSFARKYDREAMAAAVVPCILGFSDASTPERLDAHWWSEFRFLAAHWAACKLPPIPLFKPGLTEAVTQQCQEAMRDFMRQAIADRKEAKALKLAAPESKD